MNYQVINYSCIADSEGGWSVNDAHTTGLIVYVDDDVSDRDIIKQLVAVGYLTEVALDEFDIGNIDITGEPGYSLYIDSLRSEYDDAFMPLCELRALDS